MSFKSFKKKSYKQLFYKLGIKINTIGNKHQVQQSYLQNLNFTEK